MLDMLVGVLKLNLLNRLSINKQVQQVNLPKLRLFKKATDQTGSSSRGKEGKAGEPGEWPAGWVLRCLHAPAQDNPVQLVQLDQLGETCGEGWPSPPI